VGTRNVSGFDVIADLSSPGMRRREFQYDSASAAAGGQHSGGSYNVVVNATSGAATSSTGFTLVVQ